jgi:hypothetical protein
MTLSVMLRRESRQGWEQLHGCKVAACMHCHGIMGQGPGDALLSLKNAEGKCINLSQSLFEINNELFRFFLLLVSLCLLRF